MKTDFNELSTQIQGNASGRLLKSQRGIAYVLQEQGGVKITEDENLFLSPETQTKVTHLLGLTELASDLRKHLFEQASQGKMLDVTKSVPQPRVIENQESFVRELLSQNPKLLDKLAVIIAKIRVFAEVMHDQEPSDSMIELVHKIAAWLSTIDEIAHRLCGTESEQFYLLTQIETHTQQLHSPAESGVGVSDGQTKTFVKESYAVRLRKILQKPRAIGLISTTIDTSRGEALAEQLMDEYLETAFTLNAVRVLDRIQRPLDLNGKFNKLLNCLEKRELSPQYDEIIKSNNLQEKHHVLQGQIHVIQKSGFSYDDTQKKISELKDAFKAECKRVLETSISSDDAEEVVDIVSVRANITRLFQRAKELQDSQIDPAEKKQKLDELDVEMQTLLVPIGNKVNRIFPHKASTNLEQVLEKEEAICAGKVNVLLAVCKYLGINARAYSIREMLDNNTSGHVACECDLPSGNTLVIDANFRNSTDLDKVSDEKLRKRIIENNPEIREEEIEEAIAYLRLAIQNTPNIPSDSRILTYMTENTARTANTDAERDSARKEPGYFIRVNPNTGQSEIWKANIPYPHLIASPDKDGYSHINSSFTGNNAHFINRDFVDIGIYLFKKHIEMNPFDARGHIGLAGLLPSQEGFAYLESLKETHAKMYWDSISIEHAKLVAYNGDLDHATRIFEETKQERPLAYYKNAHLLASLYRSAVNKTENEDEKKRLVTQAQEILDQVRTERPEIFYSIERYIKELLQIIGNQPDQEIKLLEECENTPESVFWKADDFEPFYENLMRLYMGKIHTDQSAREKAKALANEIKERKQAHYFKRCFVYASGMYLYGYGPDRKPKLAIEMLEETKAESGEEFFDIENNIELLARTYAQVGEHAKAITLLQQTRDLNPFAFWNNKHGPLYLELAKQYDDTNQSDAAIALYETAKTESASFWESDLAGGYSRLVKLYAKTGKVDQAIALSLEAKDADPNYMNRKYLKSGYEQLAELYQQDGQIDKAIQLLLSAENTDPKFWADGYFEPVATDVAYLYSQNGQISEAILILEKMREKNSEYWKTSYYKIDELYQKAGDTEKAKQVRSESIAKFEEIKVSDPREYYRNTYKLAQLYLRDGQIQNAINALEEGKENFSFFPIIGIILLAEQYAKSGNIERAKATYQDAIEGFITFSRPDRIPEVINSAKSHGIEVEPRVQNDQDKSIS